MTAKKSTARKSSASKDATKKGAPQKAASTKGATSKPASKKRATRTAAQPATKVAPASDNITKKIEELGDWRGQTLAHVRALILEAVPDVLEEWKWAKATSPGVPVWSHDGIICTGETYKQVVKLTFARGASLEDPKKLFNSSLEGGTRRAIDIREGVQIDAAAFKKLIKVAAAANSAAKK